MRQNPHGGDIYTKKCRVDFSVNVNPLGTPESVKEAVRKSAESVEQYPDALCRDLARALSEKEQLPEENILFANGAAELIFALTQALRPKKALQRRDLQSMKQHFQRQGVLSVCIRCKRKKAFFYRTISAMI